MGAKPTWPYRIALTLLGPLLAWHGITQARRADDPRMARQKLGKDLPERNDRPVWIHMASVGEVNAAYPLVMELRRRHPELPLIVSTFTPSGAATARKKFDPDIEHVYLPLDFNGAVHNFFQCIKPRCALIMETEIWPRLFYHCRRNGIPLLIVNGRLSARSMDKPGWMRAVYRQALQHVDCILARSQTDAERFKQLGATADKIQVIDNIKFAAPGAQAPIAAIELPRPYVLAASTHDDEELQLSRAWLASELSQTYLLVIAPRHPKRKTAILQQLRPLTGGLAIRSDNDTVTNATQIYLADTFGELQGFIAGAELVCMGGSLVPRGGQNLIEAARLGKVTLFGPHMENFADERDLLLEHQAAVDVSDAGELIGKIETLLRRPEQLKAIGERAQQLVAAKADVAKRYAQALEPYLVSPIDHPRQSRRLIG